MRTLLWWVPVVAGCSFTPSGVGTTDATPADAAGDARPDAPMPDGMPPCRTFSSLFDTCPLGSSTSDLAITGSATYNTDTHMLVPTGGAATQPAHMVVATPLGSIDVLLVNSFSLAAGTTLRVTGTRPFGIAATGNVTINGAIDLAAGGAGARSGTACSTSAGTSAGGNGTDREGGASGGGGGGFQGSGGAGGEGDFNNAGRPRPPGGQGGIAVVRPNGLLGGCNGGRGGDGDAQTGGSGGAGGGAVTIATPKTLAVTGAIDVGGGGGGGGQEKRGGGGGGGSGGMILLECKALELTGATVSNGGGGGEGGDRDDSGGPGAQGTRTSERTLGGSGQANSGTDGGSGGAGPGIQGAAPLSVQFGGGGGGGGGAGYIAIACPQIANTGIISPAFAPWP